MRVVSCLQAISLEIGVWKKVGARVAAMPEICTFENSQTNSSVVRFHVGLLQLVNAASSRPRPAMAGSLARIVGVYSGRVPVVTLGHAYRVLRQYHTKFPEDTSVTESDLNDEIAASTLMVSRSMQEMNQMTTQMASQCAQQ